MGGSGEMTLEEIYAGDSNLLKLYREKLIEPGWAGELKPYELAHIRSRLRVSPSLKRRWGFKPSAKRLSEKRIRWWLQMVSLRNRKASFSFSCQEGRVIQVVYHSEGHKPFTDSYKNWLIKSLEANFS